MQNECEVLVVGAGPTGLTLATLLRRRGIDCLIIDKAAGRSQTSKAIGLQYRVSEILAWMGLLARFEQRAAKQTCVNLLVEGRVVSQLRLGQLPAAVSGAFAPRPVILPQSDTEELLGEALSEAGGVVHWRSELASLTQSDSHVEAQLVDGTSLRARYLVSCEGAHSVARKQAGIAFEGKTYPHDFIMADVAMQTTLRSGEAYSFLHPLGVLTAITMPGSQRWRLFIEAQATEVGDVSLRSIQGIYRARTGDQASVISDPTWLTRFKIHSRIVDRFRAGRVFLAGDAAHLHSPSGGQGITTGMQDATNLAWKLEHVLRYGAPEALLDTYDEERRPAAQAVLDATDRNTRLLFARGRLTKAFRDRVFLPLLATRAVQSRLVGRISQLQSGYREASLAAGATHLWQHGLRAGDRAPDVLLDGDKPLFSLLGASSFCSRADPRASAFCSPAVPRASSVALFARENPALARCLERLGVKVALLSPPARQVYGASEDVWLIRPDGYIAYRGPLRRPDPLRAYLPRMFATATLSAAFRDLPAPMRLADKLLYHQLHPLKLLVDFATSFWSSWLLWERNWTLAPLVAFAPSIVVSALLMAWVDLEWLRETPLGRYVARAMNRKIEALRFAGQIVMWLGAALHLPWLLPLGLLVVLLAWANGLWTQEATVP